MGENLLRFLPRFAVVVLVALAVTATLTYAAGRKLAAAPPAVAKVVQKPATVVVPDVRNEAFVFAKSQLQDAGFAWHVDGGVHGYAANTVVAQAPAPGTKLVDTGAPLITVTLRANKTYPQAGEAEDSAPYAATAVRLADAAVAVAPKLPAKKAAPAKAAPTKKQAQQPKRHAYPQQRPVAFVVPGARKEPLDEMPLPDRAAALGAWLSHGPKKTNANVKHWLYQNDWIVAGARMGWWRGAEALRTLVAVDGRTIARWGIGAKSEAVARRALAEVEARAR